MPISDADIVSAFEWILGREPEAEAIAWHRKNFSTREDLQRHLFNSAEFMNFLPFSMDAGRDTALDFLRPRVVFLHLPKTGGTSLASLLESAFKEDEVFPDRYMIARHPAAFIAKHRLFHGKR